MATRYSTHYTDLIATPVKKLQSGLVLKPLYGTYVQTTTNIATGDVLVLDKLPAGYIVVSGCVFTSADQATTAYIFDCGLYTDVPATPVVVDRDAYFSVVDRITGPNCIPFFDTPTAVTACNRPPAAVDQLICLTYTTVTAPLACTIYFVGMAMKVI